jgi:dTDP-4-dehydrorhamnose 3,5-epimerase
VPSGFAHGFETLVDGTEIFYQMTGPHVPGAERGIIWNDPDLAIAWPEVPAVMSDRDRALPRLRSGRIS